MKRWWVFLVLGLLLTSGGVALTVSELIVRRLAQAIANAEGFFVPGSVPNRLNNPGDLTLDLTGAGVGKEGIYVIYPTPAAGWEALYKQVRLMFSGSHIYNPLMTIAEIANHYTATEQQAWAKNVADFLGVSVNTRLSELL